MKTVLLIDDEDDIRVVAQMSLEMTAGRDIEAANCGRLRPEDQERTGGRHRLGTGSPR